MSHFSDSVNSSDTSLASTRRAPTKLVVKAAEDPSPVFGVSLKRVVWVRKGEREVVTEVKDGERPVTVNCIPGIIFIQKGGGGREREGRGIDVV